MTRDEAKTIVAALPQEAREAIATMLETYYKPDGRSYGDWFDLDFYEDDAEAIMKCLASWVRSPKI